MVKRGIWIVVLLAIMVLMYRLSPPFQSHPNYNVNKFIEIVGLLQLITACTVIILCIIPVMKGNILWIIAPVLISISTIAIEAIGYLFAPIDANHVVNMNDLIFDVQIL
jgi:hypothetical protein